MRFDTARAVEWAATFDFPRAAGTDGERHAGEIAAVELGRLGLKVERADTRGTRLPAMAEPWLGWVGLGLWATGLALVTQRSAWPLRLAFAVLALLWLRLTTVERFLLGKACFRRVAVTNVIAWRESEGDPPPVRVVFHTPLDTFDPGRAFVPVWLSTPVIALLLCGQIVAALTIHRNPLRLPPWAGWCFLVPLWLAIAGRVWGCVRGRAGPDLRDNRTGLAVLLELARGWPRGTDRRIETRFVATAGRALDRAGLRALIDAIGNEWPPRPTLVVEWIAPGIGPGLTLREQGTNMLAATAAADLWIPHRVVHRAVVGREHWPVGRHGPGYIGLVGSAVTHGRWAGGAQAIEPEALGRTAQLATEVALRWARKMKEPEAPQPTS